MRKLKKIIKENIIPVPTMDIRQEVEIRMEMGVYRQAGEVLHELSTQLDNIKAVFSETRRDLI